MPSMPLYISDEQLNHTKHKGFNIFKDLLKLYKNITNWIYLISKFHLFLSIIFRIKFVVSGGGSYEFTCGGGGLTNGGGSDYGGGGIDPGWNHVFLII